MSVDGGVSAASKARGERSRSRPGGAICFERATDDGRDRIRLNQNVEPGNAGDIPTITVDNDPDARTYADALPDSPLPGSGEQYGTCGDDVPALACDDCGSVGWVGSTCRRSRCPRCWRAWAFYTAIEAIAATDGTRRKRASEPGPNPYNHHVVVSFPDGTRFNSDDALDRGFGATKRFMMEVGADAGMLLFHPYRIKEEYRGDVMGHSSGDGDKQWKDILDMPPEDREEYLVYSPHFHVFAVSDFIQGGAITEKIEDRTGVVIERIADDDGVSLADMDALAAATAYSLSHAGLTADGDDDAHRAAYRYFGETANIERRANVRADAKEAMRRVAPDVLGVDFSRRTCDEPVTDSDDSGEYSGGKAGSVDANPRSNVLDSVFPGDADETPASGPAARPTASSGAPDAEADDADGWQRGNTGGFATDSGVPDAPSVTSVRSDDDGHDHVDATDSDDTEECGGSMLPIWVIREKLDENDVWREKIGSEAAEGIRDAYDQWADMGEPVPGDMPDAPPPDTPAD